MLSALKQRLEAKKAKARAIAASGYWKTHAHLQECLQALRGSCTVAPMELHEAAIAAVNIALQENTWIMAEKIPGDFLPQTVYIVWNDAQLPVFQAILQPVLEILDDVTAVAHETYLVSETMTRIVRCDNRGKCQLYSIEPED